MKRNQFQLKEGERLKRTPNKPIIRFVSGGQPYLWIGNNNHRERDLACFGTLSNQKTLRELAERILEGLSHETL